MPEVEGLRHEREDVSDVGVALLRVRGVRPGIALPHMTAVAEIHEENLGRKSSPERGILDLTFSRGRKSEPISKRGSTSIIQIRSKKSFSKVSDPFQ